MTCRPCLVRRLLLRELQLLVCRSPQPWPHPSNVTDSLHEAAEADLFDAGRSQVNAHGIAYLIQYRTHAEPSLSAGLLR